MNFQQIPSGLLIALIVVLSLGFFLYYLYLRRKSIKEYEELHDQYTKEINEAENNAKELATDISDLVNFILSYSLFRKARGKERKKEAMLEMLVWWHKIPREAQEALTKIGKEAGLKPTDST